MILTDVAVPKKAKKLGWLRPDRGIDLTVVLSPKVRVPSAGRAQPAKQNATPVPHLTHAELRKKFGAAAHSAEMVEAFARKFDLDVIETAPRRRTLRLRGRAADVGRAFKTRFAEFELDGVKFFAPVRPPQTPARWNGVVEALLGLQSLRRSSPWRSSMVHARAASRSVQDLAQTYAFPAGLDGAGQTIGIIEFGGGFRPEDIHEFCARMGLASPRITVVRLGAGANRPASRQAIHEFLDVVSGTLALSAEAEHTDSFENAQDTIEVTMDVEMVAALAPKAHIVVYFAAPEEQGMYNALSRAVHDERHRPGVLCISWGLPESSFSKSEMRAIEGVLCEAAQLGITVCASSGDAGALNGSKNGRPSVNYPASSPHCLACGGTSLKSGSDAAMSEVVWNATHHGIKGASGGGVSERFPLPSWQAYAHVPAAPGGRKGRGLPDVAGLADPRSGCEMRIAGRAFTSSGTSAVAPMWGALVARLNQALGWRCGHLHPHLYRLGRERTVALRPVLRGNNGLYRARRGWNACTGYGTPQGTELLAHLRNAQQSQAG